MNEKITLKNPKPQVHEQPWSDAVVDRESREDARGGNHTDVVGVYVYMEHAEYKALRQLGSAQRELITTLLARAEEAFIESGKDATQTYREAARDFFHDEGRIEVDDNATVSMSEDGAYVQAWVWVDAEDAGLGEEEEEEL